ncbi:MAG: 16S rRNA (cytosine(967)-C(5))-methyltransferase RsmB [Thermodesulfovibrionales bacterium]|nr:16S rRNA (cytosine(967)-C(5))-methyltransferase RsmB [Thermodesulfovibrionales bacterium]
MSTVRELAVKALTRIGRDARPKEEIESLGAGLDARDRAFLVELVYGSLRHRITLEWMLARFLDHPGDLPEETRMNLLVGMYQLIHLRVPDRAAVNEAVEMEDGLKGLVNAVLRNAIRQKDTILAEIANMERGLAAGRTSGEEQFMAASITTSHPLWLVRRWISRLGLDDALALMRANNEIPPLALRVNTLKASRDEVLESLSSMDIDAKPSKRSPYGIILGGTLPFSELKSLTGLVMAQDEAAQLVCSMLGLSKGERVLDACAAPGGKAAHMAELTGDSGEVLAVEMDSRRADTLRENISRMGYKSVKVMNADITAMDKAGHEPFDAVLVDAPCSSLGVVRRNPDIKGRRQESDLALHAARQLSILSASAQFVRPGGRLLYCTCSTEPEEGEQVVEKFLRRRSDFYIIDDAPVPGGGLSGGVFRSWPHQDGMDGFFAIRMDRRK